VFFTLQNQPLLALAAPVALIGARFFLGMRKRVFSFTGAM
jgi:hypothetical protein